MKSVLILLTVTLSGFSYAQKYDSIYLGTDKYNFYQLPGAKEKIKGIPHVEVFFVVDNVGYGDTLYIIGVYPDMKKNKELHAVLGIAYGETVMYNAAKMYDDPWYSNDTIYIKSQQPYRAAYVTLHWLWNDKTKMFEMSPDFIIEDASEEKLVLGDSLLAQGNITGAVDAYSGIEYPTSYMNENTKGKEIMTKAHEMAMVSFKAGKYKEAAGYISKALEFWANDLYINFSTEKEFTDYLVDEYGEKWTKEEVKLWLGDYGLFLYKAGMADKSIEINSYLNTILPETTGPYLQLADAYFDKGDKVKAKEIYKKYAGLMKTQKREKDIPKRVKERMK